MEMEDLVAELYAPQLKAQEEVKHEQGLEGEKLRVAALNLLASDDGRRFICAVLEQSGIFTSSFTGNSSTFFLEGKRYVGLYIYKLLMMADPQALQKLVNFRLEQRQGEKNA